MKRHPPKVHRRVSPHSPTLSNSPESFQASQMRDRLAVAREQLEDPSLLSRGVLSFHRPDEFLSDRVDQRVLVDVEDHRRSIFRDSNKIMSSRGYFLINGKAAVHSPDQRVARVSRDGRLFWLPQSVRDQFQLPQKTVVCVRRENRRRVLFALQKIGSGSGGKRIRRARWNESSRIVCRRR